MTGSLDAYLDDLVHRRRYGALMDFRRENGPANEDEAYQWQQRGNSLLHGSFGPVAGLKIGCTTPVMRAFLGIGSPAAGEIFSSTLHDECVQLTHSYYCKVGVECEIAVRTGIEIAPDGPPPKPEDVVASVHSAAEIVDNRYADYKAMGVNWLIADNFFNTGAVIGPPVTNWRDLDLAGLQGFTRINGAEVGRGSGASVMGHPFHALDWLVRRRQASGLGIAKGTIILLGSVVETKWLARGDHADIAIAGLIDLPLSIAVN